MSKRAEERGLEALPPRWRKTRDGKGKVDSALPVRKFYIRAYEQAEKDLGWISVKDRLPEERKYESDNLQGHHEWTESDRVFVLDDRGVAMVDSLRNGKFWLDGKKDCDGFPHYIEYWMPIPKLPKEEER